MAGLVIQFAVGPGGRIEVHVVAGGLESQMHAEVGGGGGSMDLILEIGLLKVSGRVLKGGEGIVVVSEALLWRGVRRDLVGEDANERFRYLGLRTVNIQPFWVPLVSDSI